MVSLRETWPAVGAVVVTYSNRWIYLCQVLEALETQSCPLAEVVLVSNGSRYLDHEVVQRFRLSVTLLSLDSNQGSAVGFGAGIRKCLDAGVDLVWLLDDDNLPRKDALEHAVQCYRDNGGPIICNRQIPGIGERAVGRGVTNSFLGFDLVSSSMSLCCRFVSLAFPRGGNRGDQQPGEYVSLAPYGGLLVATSTVREAGLPRTDFVTYGDDSEWTSRIVSKAGLIRQCRGCEIEELERSWSIRTSRLNPLVSCETPTVRVYYLIRNQAFMEFEAASSRVLFFVNVSIRLFVLLGNSLAFSRSRKCSFARWRLMVEAVRDGVAGRLGRWSGDPDA